MLRLCTHHEAPSTCLSPPSPLPPPEPRLAMGQPWGRVRPTYVLWDTCLAGRPSQESKAICLPQSSPTLPPTSLPSPLHLFRLALTLLTPLSSRRSSPP